MPRRAVRFVVILRSSRVGWIPNFDSKRFLGGVAMLVLVIRGEFELFRESLSILTSVISIGK